MAEETAGRSYGGKWKKWLLIYLAIAVVAYVVVYFVFIRDTGASGSGGTGGTGGGDGGGTQGGGYFVLAPLVGQALAYVRARFASLRDRAGRTVRPARV